MRFCSKMDKCVDVVIDEDLFHKALIADIALDKNRARILCRLFQIVQTPRIGEQIEIHNLFALIVLQTLSYERRADKTGAASYKQILKHILSQLPPKCAARCPIPFQFFL